MRPLLFTLISLLSQLSYAQEGGQYKRYSFTEFFRMVEEEPSDEFVLENVLIVLDTIVDKGNFYKFDDDGEIQESFRQDAIHIRKPVRLKNVLFDPYYIQFAKHRGVLQRIVFHEAVRFENVFANFQDIHFKRTTRVYFNAGFSEMLQQNFGQSQFETIRFENCIFEIDPRIICTGGIAKDANPLLLVRNCNFKSNPEDIGDFILLREFGRIIFDQNVFQGSDFYSLRLMSNNEVHFENNDFGDRFITFELPEDNVSVIYNNNRHNYLFGLTLSESIPNLTMDWSQLENGLIDGFNFIKYMGDTFSDLPDSVFNPLFSSRKLVEAYKDSIRIANNSVYKSEIKLLGTLTGVYKRQHDTQSANASYITLKDLETERLEYLYDQNPTFDTFFEWKVNQFLKLFSDYGTKPAKAITMSVYVVFIFALVYLFFPNYWDSHGKNRIKDRFLFFHKYLRHNKGIQDVYLEEQQAELQSAYAFQQVLDEHKTEVPGFFYSAAKPLYRWSVAGTTLYAKLLSRVDFLKGSWKETDPKKRKLRTALTIVVFVFALLYDIFIKILNALMLSINTFTTLGFGEIPIKGLPRYLAIIQGFIGWFMLTIFSVSLISQLLN